MANQKNQTSNEGGRGKQGSGSPGTTSSASTTGSTPTADMSGGGTTGSVGTGSTGFDSGTGSAGVGGSAGIGAAGSGSSSTNTGTTGQMSTSGTAGGSTGTGTAVARSLYDQAKETAGQAYEVAAEKATTKLEEQKTTLSGGLATVADSVRRVSDNLRGPDVQDGISKFTAQYSDTAARKIEDVANYFEQKSVREMYTDVERFARRNPAVFVGSAFALGLLLSRFLKSGAERSHTIGGGHSSHQGSISTASDEGSGQGVQGISAGDMTPGSSIS